MALPGIAVKPEKKIYIYFKEANQKLAWGSPFKIPQEAVTARKDTIHMNENYRWDFMANSEFLQETILKESA